MSAASASTRPQALPVNSQEPATAGNPRVTAWPVATAKSWAGRGGSHRRLAGRANHPSGGSLAMAWRIAWATRERTEPITGQYIVCRQPPRF
jgi:hypothetical protein